MISGTENDVSLVRFMNSPRVDWNGPNVALLRANKEIANAGIRIFYLLNTFSVSPQVHDVDGKF